jgi:hypothetical protein
MVDIAVKAMLGRVMTMPYSRDGTPTESDGRLRGWRKTDDSQYSAQHALSGSIST